MGRPKGGKNKKYSYEFKLKVMEDYFDNHFSKNEVMNKYSISNGTFYSFRTNYEKGTLETGRTRNRGIVFAALHTSKSLSREERLELENLKLKTGNERLKKGYLAKGGGAGKEYVSIFDANTKSSKD